MNTQKYPQPFRPMRLLSLACVVSCLVLTANCASAESLIFPSEFANREGSSDMGHGNPGPFRVHFLYLGSEFPQEPIDIIGIRLRPKSATPTQTAINRDVQLNLTTTNEAILKTDFGLNLDMALQPPIPVINGTVEISTIRPTPNQSPRTFDYEFSWETPFRYNPADGTNLLLDFRANGYNHPPLYDAINSPTERPNTPRIVLEEQTFGRGYYPAFWVTQFLYNRADGAPEYLHWNIDSDGNSSAAGNWTRGVPNRTGARAVFGSVITSPHTVTVDAAFRVGRLDFENDKPYTLAGKNILTVAAATGDAQINVARGSHRITAPVTLADNTTITVTPAASNLSLTGSLNANGRNLTKVGDGTLTVNNLRAAGVSVNGGTVAIAPSGAAAGTSVLRTLTIAGTTDAWTAKLDLANNDAVVQSSAANKPADFARLYNQLKQGFNNGAWTGSGITSTSAASNATADTGLSVVDNTLLGYTNFSGQPVSADSILLKYTYYGDIDQNGQVDADDLTVFASNFGRTSGTTQVDGDIDFNGAVNADDLTVFANNFNKGVGNPLAVAAASVQAVPEPGTLRLAALGAAGILLGLMRRLITLSQRVGF